MISKIGFKNIRVFEDLTEFELKPITILTGPNNSGKSSIQKILILLSSGLQENDTNVDLETLYFKKDFINKTGDFISNVNYNSNKNELIFSFSYIDEIFGNMEALLTYKENKYNNGELSEIIFYNNNETLISFKKNNKPDKNIDDFPFYGEFIWEINKKQYKEYILKLYEKLIALRNLGEKQFVLNEIAFKIQMGNLENLTKKEEDVYNYYKNKGIIAGDDRAKNDYVRQVENKWCVWDENTDNVFEESDVLNKIYHHFKKCEFDNFLIHTKLLDIIGDDYNAFISSKKNKDLVRMFLDNNIFTYQDFLKHYKTFEILIIHNVQKNFLNTCEWEKYSESAIPLDIDKILAKNNNFPNSITEYENYMEGNLIVEILKNNDLIKVEKREPNNKISIKVLESSVKGDNTKQPPAKDKDENSQGFFNSPFVSLKESIIDLITQVKASLQVTLQNDLKKYYLIGEFDTNNSPFIEYGINYFKYSYFKDKSNFVNKWLKELEIADELLVKEIKVGKNTIGYSYFLLINKVEVPLGDNGIGINQLILLLLKIVTNNRIIHLLEEPEVNMHPKLQSKLADLFVDAKKEYNSNFIIETHSEYLIRKFQYLVAKNDINKNELIIYYFNSEKYVTTKKKRINEIKINKNGGLTDTFGSGFFDETSRLQYELLKLNKSQNN